jgi:hypothetical protein
MAKAQRSTPKSIGKAVHAGKMKKISYLVERAGAIEFTPPVQTPGNRMLANHALLFKIDESGKASPEGKLGQVTRFFIPKKELARLSSIFTKFSIPEELRPDLTWCYLNMAVAAADAPASDQWNLGFDKQLFGLRSVLDFLEKLDTGSVKISSVIIRYAWAPDTKSRKPPAEQKLKLLGPLDAGYFEEILKLFRQVKETPLLDSFSKSVIKSPETRLVTGNMGYKNAQKHAQAYYAGQLYDFLIRNVFSSVAAHTHDLQQLKAETTKLKKIYSDRQLCLFVGTLMLEAGLMTPPKEEIDKEKALIDLIKKKLGRRLTAGAIPGKNAEKK